jgi:hypothetical protein
VHKTTVEIDLEELRKAEHNLGTHGFKETINRALERINRQATFERAVFYLEGRHESVPNWDAFQAGRRKRI